MVNRLTFLLIVLLLCSCADPQQEIEQAMKTYDGLILRVEADSIANTFIENGEMGEVGKTLVVGRNSIRSLLKTFSHFHVLENRSITKSIKIGGDTARQEGTFAQKVVVGADTLNAKGEYFATWVQIKEHRWLLKRMLTKSQ